MSQFTHSVFGTSQAIGPLQLSAGSVIQFTDAVKLLDVTLDSTVTFDQHRPTTNVVRACTYHMRALRHIRPLLTTDAAKTIASAITGARLDYCNSLLYGSSVRNLDRLQKVQNQLAQVLFCSCLGRRVSRTLDANCTGCRSHNELSLKWRP